MANFAYIKDDGDIEYYDFLPQNWKNISNFNAIDDLDFLKSLGWHKIVHVDPVYDPETQYLGNPSFVFDNDTVYQHMEVLEKELFLAPPEVSPDIRWQEIRRKRDELILAFEWRITRHYREIRLGMQATDNIRDIDVYLQALADIPQAYSDPDQVIWPVFAGGA